MAPPTDQTNSFKLEFGTPEHGWLPIKVSSETQVCELEVSDVPCDSLEMLVSAISLLEKGSSTEEVEWHLEPVWAKWIFAAKENKLTFRIMVDDKIKFTFTSDRKELLTRICRQLLSETSGEVWSQIPNDDIWPWPFKRDRLREVLDRMN